MNPRTLVLALGLALISSCAAPATEHARQQGYVDGCIDGTQFIAGTLGGPSIEVYIHPDKIEMDCINQAKAKFDPKPSPRNP